MRLIIACRSFDNVAGGVERQSIALANEMVSRGHSVAFITWDKQVAEAFYKIDPKVEWYKVGTHNPKVKASLSQKLERFKIVRKIAKNFQADVVLGFQQGMFLSMRVYLSCLNIPVIAAERESPFRYDFIKDGKIKSFIFQTFRLAKAITVQCPSYVEEYPRYLQKKMSVIPNSVFPTKKSAKPEGSDNERKILLCVARLSFAKNQEVLLKSFSQLSEKFKDWDLHLAGEGEDRAKIEKLIIELNLKNRVKLLGAITDVSSLYIKAHLFCLPSRWEGFPNVLGEAMAHGLPAVGYEGCGGVRDLITHEENGLLASGNGDVKSLTEMLYLLMTNSSKRQKMGLKAQESIKEYNPEKVYDIWELFLSAQSRK